MTDAASAGTPRDRAKARVHALLDEPLREAVDAGFLIVVPLGEIVDAVAAETGDAALRLPRYYPDDEGAAWPVGRSPRIDPDTGVHQQLYMSWRTLPEGRVHVMFSEHTKTDPPVLVEFTAASDELPHPLRMLLAGCEHSNATAGGAV